MQSSRPDGSYRDGTAFLAPDSQKWRIQRIKETDEYFTPICYLTVTAALRTPSSRMHNGTENVCKQTDPCLSVLGAGMDVLDNDKQTQQDMPSL